MIHFSDSLWARVLFAFLTCVCLAGTTASHHCLRAISASECIMPCSEKRPSAGLRYMVPTMHGKTRNFHFPSLLNFILKGGVCVGSVCAALYVTIKER